jgi:hypothetical protein
MKKWSGVFPATTTQFGRDESLDVAATQKVVAALIDDGVDGVICMGTVGENCSLSAAEKRTVMAAIKEVVGGRVPVLSGVAEYTTALVGRFSTGPGSLPGHRLWELLLLVSLVVVPLKSMCLECCSYRLCWPVYGLAFSVVRRYKWN